MFSSPFNSQPKIVIPQECDIIFVADLFKEDYVGGAELTTAALIESSPFKVFKLRSNQVTIELLEQGHKKYWIFGNFAGLNMELIPTIAANMTYSILEYDYKFCQHRSIEKHQNQLNAEGHAEECDCHIQPHGSIISAFMYGAKSLWWMSEKQQKIYFDRFPFLEENENWVLSSMFDEPFWLALKMLREKYKNADRKGWIVLGSNSWIKGASAAAEWCKENNKEYEVVWNLPYEEVLEKLAQAEGFVYLPLGGDTCPRMVIEAKLLGCKLHINENVEHAHELWFDTEEMFDTEAYLYAGREKFWRCITNSMNYMPTLSGYTTTRNCIHHNYPWRAAISSMLEFCNEVIVVDGGSDDGTWDELLSWSEVEPRLKVSIINRDWDHPRFAVYDGLQKAVARSACNMEYCWQMDADEVVHENDFQKIKNLIKNFPKEVDLISLPVIEYWGSSKKVRMDINPWKWRLSRNKDHITHGIPDQLRKTDKDGHLYAAPGTDGCDYINAETYEVINHASFYNEEIHRLKVAALNNLPGAQEKYEEWFERVTELLPGVHHYSWYDLERKIRTYKDYWSQHWQSLYDIPQEDTAENNMFFDKSWSEVTADDIKKLASRLANETGGWVFHSKIDWSKPTPYITLKINHPETYLKHENCN